jgi:LacI family transcriptional regulator
MRVTIKEIARELGISHSTVSRVLNDKQSAMVSETTRERIRQAATRMGYRPNRLAQALKNESTRLIGVLLPDEENYFYQSVLANLRACVEQSGYELLLTVSAQGQVTSNWFRLLRWELDGIFVFDYMFYTDGLWQALQQYTGYVPPVVGLFSHETQLQDYVAVDFKAALESLLCHLMQQGRRSLGYMALPSSFGPTEQRYTLCKRFARAHKLSLLDMPLLPEKDLRAAARRTLIRHVQAGHPLPDALYCQDDEICLGAYRALAECGVPVPDRVALAGCDDIPYISYLETPLTTLALPVREVCRQGWRILQNRMAAPDSPPWQVTLEATLHLRASTEQHAQCAVRSLVSGGG